MSFARCLLNKYHIQTTPDTFNNKSQLDLFKDLIYHYFIHNSDIDLKKLAKFYFQHKDNYSYNSSEQGLLAIVLRWETDVGLAFFDLVMSKYYTSFFYVFLWSVIFIVGYATAMYFLNHIGNFFTFKEE